MGLFILNSILLGVGLAMDAFSVSMANGLAEPHMKKGRMAYIAGVFALFQFIMPLAGWFCVHTIASLFTAFQKFIPWIALILLCWIGGGMLKEGFSHKEVQEAEDVSHGKLIVQGIATSIDALSVGFTIAEYSFPDALAASLIIGLVTFFICYGGCAIGRKFGMKLAGRASILGGVILIAIGLEIFLSNML